jgi:transposase-like protein
MADIEIMARVERRRKWSAEEKAALMEEIAAEGGKVRVVARRHRIAESLLYNWRAAWKAAASAAGSAEFVPLGVFHGADKTGMAMLPSSDSARTQPAAASDARSGAIEIALPDGRRVSVDAFVNEKAADSNASRPPVTI